MENSEIIKKLSSINWNFDFTIDYGDDSLHPFNCRKYYSYPATFIPEIPYALIEILSKKGDVVLDPFGGIGTTFMQALTLQRIPYSYDINPVAFTVCKTIYELFNPLVDKEEIKKALLAICEGYDGNQDYADALSSMRKDLAGWFEKTTFNEIAFLFSKCEEIKDQIVSDTMRLVLTSILVTLSSQNKGWAYIADNVKPKSDELRRKPVFEQYKNAVKCLLNDVIKHEGRMPADYKDFYGQLCTQPRVFADSLANSSLNPETVDLIVTSPPYPRMIDYVKSQRLSFGFLDKSFADYAPLEIGARYRRSRRDCLTSYEDSIKQVNEKMISLLKHGGYLCAVLPDYDSSDNRKAVIEKVIDDYRQQGLTKVFEVGRYIPSHKRTLSIQWATLVNERIYIFQKG